VEWDVGTEADLAGHTVYWGQDAAALSSALFVPIPGASATVSGIKSSQTYFYAVEAEDTSGCYEL
jgi:hypothetical protein